MRECGKRYRQRSDSEHERKTTSHCRYRAACFKPRRAPRKRLLASTTDRIYIRGGAAVAASLTLLASMNPSHQRENRPMSTT